MKRLQFKLNDRIFAVEIKEQDTYEEDINEAMNKLAEQINGNNETIQNIFFECLEVVCSECGKTLNLDEEKTICIDCEANQI
jgi:Zn finger protein HypA/HybF involved in hydrogenase expression